VIGLLLDDYAGTVHIAYDDALLPICIPSHDGLLVLTAN